MTDFFAMLDALGTGLVVPDFISDNWRSRENFFGPPGLKVGQRPFSISLAAFPFTNFGVRIERRKDSEVGFHRLKIFEGGMCDIMTQGTEHRGLRNCQKFMLMKLA